MSALPAPSPPPAHCLNCGTPVTDVFCSHCGQNDRAARRLNTQQTFEDLVRDFFKVDGKFLRSLGLLVARPGLLTRDFVEGRRARHLTPGRLYVVVNFAFFLIVQWFDPVTADIIAETVGEAYVAAETARGLGPDGFAAAVEGRMARLLPTYLFALVPAFAAVLLVLYAGQRRPLVAHVVFGLHFVSFFLFALTPSTITSGPLSDALVLAGFAAIPVYLTLALRRAYGEGWTRTLVKGALASVAFFVLVSFYIYNIMLWALRV